MFRKKIKLHIHMNDLATGEEKTVSHEFKNTNEMFTYIQEEIAKCNEVRDEMGLLYTHPDVYKQNKRTYNLPLSTYKQILLDEIEADAIKTLIMEEQVYLILNS